MPWVCGKLDFSPRVADLSREGFVLVGGRLDYVRNRAVAALVYRSGKHEINLFMWPALDSSERHETTQGVQGYHLIHWTAGAMEYWAISDVNEGALRNFVISVQSGAGSATTR